MVGASVLYHLTRAGVDRRGAGRAARAHLRLDVARGWWHAHAERRPQRLQAAAVHDRALQGDRSRAGAGLHDPPARRADAGRQPRAPRLAADGAGPRAVPRHGARDHHGRRGQRLFPLMEDQYFVGALFDPVEGHVDPTGVTNAYAIRARNGGPRWSATRWSPTCASADGTWDVITDRGEIHAEHIVNAGGLWAREVGRMVGIELPVLAMEQCTWSPSRWPRSRPQRPDRPRDADGARLRRRDLHQAGAGRDAARDL